MKKNVLRQCIYDLYKQEWLHSHLSNQQMKDSIVDYYEGLEDSSDEYTFEEYLEEYGFINGEMYACYDEFIDIEYHDEEYIESLLEDYPKLLKEYQEDYKEE
jgi:hypothetical protein